MANDIKLTDAEEKFCMVYACGPSPYNGNAKMSYDLVFKGSTGRFLKIHTNRGNDRDKLISDEVDSSIAANRLLRRDAVKDRIEELQSESLVNASTLRPRLTETLLRIADECSTLTLEDRFGVALSPAALRSVAVNAISKLTDMYGIKEDIAHKVTVEGANGDGITFNLIMPEKKNENEIEKLL